MCKLPTQDAKCIKKVKSVTHHVSVYLAKPGRGMVSHLSKLKWRTYNNAG